MRLGLLPSQKRALDQAFKKARAFDRFRQRTRRAFLGLGLLGVCAGVGGFVLGRSWQSEPDQGRPDAEIRARWQAKLPWAQTYGEQPIATLSASYATFLMVIQMTGGDDRTWRGFARLAEHALSAADSDPNLGRALLQTSRFAPPPEWLRPLVDQLAKTQR